MLFAYIAVQRLQVEIELAKILRLKLIYLEFKGDKSVKAAMEEKQIKCKIPPANLYGKFRADKAEISAKLQYKILHAVEQGMVKIVFGVLLRQAKKFEGVGILENALGLRVDLR